MPVPAAFMKKGRKAAEGSAAEEKSESPMVEKGEGPEYGDAPHGKKPCAKCAKKGKKKGSCGCDKGGKMDAALTPMEYLDACDLGIQDRSKSYIRARLDAMATAGKGQGTKCGNGYIGRGKKCRSGAGGALAMEAPKKPIDKKGEIAGKALRAAAFAGGVASNVKMVQNALRGNINRAKAYGYAAGGFDVLGGQGKIIQGKATNNSQLQQRGKNQRAFAIGYHGVKSVLTGDLQNAAKGLAGAAKLGYERAQAKKNNRYRNMSNEEYSAAARAAGNPEGPSRRWSQRKGSVNTTARAVPAGLLRGSSGPAPDRKTTAAERDFTNARAAAWRKRAGGK